MLDFFGVVIFARRDLEIIWISGMQFILCTRDFTGNSEIAETSRWVLVIMRGVGQVNNTESSKANPNKKLILCKKYKIQITCTIALGLSQLQLPPFHIKQG